MYGDIYYNPATKAILLSGIGYTFEDGVEGHDAFYACFAIAPQVTVFTVNDSDSLDPESVVVYATEDVGLTDAQLMVDPELALTEENLADIANVAAAAQLDVANIICFDVSFVKDAEIVEPTGGVTLRMPVPEGFNTEKLAVFHIGTDGVQMVEFHVANCFIFAKAAFGFSPYVVAQVEESQSSEVPEGFEALPFGSDGLEAGAYYFDIDAMVQDTIVNNQIPAEVATEEFKAEMKAAMLADLGTVYYNADTGAIHAAVCGVVTPEDDMYAAFAPYVKQAEGDGPQVDEAVEAVITKIDAIGEVAYTAESKALIDDADEAYAALTDEQKANVTNAADLTAAKETYAQLKAQADAAAEAAANQAAANAVIAKINAIGEVAYTDESKAKIDDARTAYDVLTAAQKKLVSNYATLTAAESRYAELKAAAETPTDPTEPENPNEPANDNICKWDNVDHGTSIWGKIVKFFHTVLYFFAHLFGKR